MNELMDLKEAYERIEWQIKHDVENYDKDPTVAGIIDLERIKEAIDELATYKQKEDKLREKISKLSHLISTSDTYIKIDDIMFVDMSLELNRILQILNEGYK